jgi:hypothetical protein
MESGEKQGPMLGIKKTVSPKIFVKYLLKYCYFMPNIITLVFREK